MSIPEVIKKINPIANFKDKIYHPLIYRVKEGFDVKEDVFIILAIILIGLAGFGLGKLSALEKGRETVTIKPTTLTATATTINSASTSAMIAGENAKSMLVASKNGTKYYFPWCSGVSKINESNKVWFDSYESAQKAGLTAAANCPNLK
jgi:hypothetical protein